MERAKRALDIAQGHGIAVSLAGGAPDPFARRAAVVEHHRFRTERGLNLLAELEALTALGAGRFEVGVHHALNLFRAFPLAERSGAPVEDPFADREDKRHWRLRLYEDDAILLRSIGSPVSIALTHVLAAAWPHMQSGYRERILARLAELPDDAMAKSWKAAGGAPWWEPPRAGGEQTHLVVSDAALYDPGIRL